MTKVPGNRLSPERIKEWMDKLVRYRKFEPERFIEAMAREKDIWRLIVSMHFYIIDLEKKLAKEVKLREEANKIIDRLKKL
mgnify:CR=1 FL=1